MKPRLAMCFLLAAQLACSQNPLADERSGAAGDAATAGGAAGSGGSAVSPGVGGSPGGAAGRDFGSAGAGDTAGSLGAADSGGSGSGGVGGSGGTGGGRLDGGARDVATPDSRADASPEDNCGGDRPGPFGPVGGLCGEIERAWNEAVRKDQACTPGMANQCSMMATAFGCVVICGPVLVNGTVNTDALRKRWQEAGCASCARVCPAATCVRPRPVACRAVGMAGAAVIGQCTAQ